MTTNKAIEILKSYKTYTFTSEENYKESISVEEIIELLQKPVKVGKWIPHKDKDGEYYGHDCSACGEWYVMPYGRTKYCPNCGAKMEG